MGIIFLLFFIGGPIVAIIMAKRKGPSREVISPTRRHIQNAVRLFLALFFSLSVIVTLIRVIFFDVLADAHTGYLAIPAIMICISLSAMFWFFYLRER
jgi:hypothetical protein